MRIAFEAGASLLASAICLTACAGGAQTSVPSAPASQTASRSGPDLGVLQPDAYAGLKDIYVTDLSYGAVDLLKNKGYFLDGSIGGFSTPVADFLDLTGNLYVADYSAVAIDEFAPGKDAPSHVYSQGALVPVGVTVDRHGNVFEADYGSSGEYNGFVGEYEQGKNAMIHMCSPGGSVQGVAVDTAGDVFADYDTAAQGAIVEYKGGLAGCKGTVLGATLKSAGGMASDAHADLVVCDLVGHVVDVIQPPYTSVARTIGPSYGHVQQIALSRDNKKAFAADGVNDAVYVIDYQSGVTDAVIKGSYFFVAPSGVVDGPNAVY